MNKTELIAMTAERSGVTKKDTEQVVEALLQTVTAVLAEGDRVQITGFGSFETKLRAERVGRDPKTKEAVKIPATRVVAFKPSKALKETIAQQGE